MRYIYHVFQFLRTIITRCMPLHNGIWFSLSLQCKADATTKKAGKVTENSLLYASTSVIKLPTSCAIIIFDEIIVFSQLCRLKPTTLQIKYIYNNKVVVYFLLFLVNRFYVLIFLMGYKTLELSL